MATPGVVAKYMLKRLEEEKYLYQEVIVYEIEARFGEEFVYINVNGNPAISRRVLKQFRKLTEGDVVWDRGEKMWRKREAYDPLGTRQVD